jgi:L-asparagine transporter-like permease
LFATVGNKYIIDSILPESSNFTLVDSLHTLTFLAIFATLVVSSLALHRFDMGDKESSVRYNKLGAKIVIAAYFIANVILVTIAIV